MYIQYSRNCTKVRISTNYELQANLKKCVFINDLKQFMSFALLISNGKSFHKIGPAYLRTEYQDFYNLQRRTSSSNALLDLRVDLDNKCSLFQCLSL